MSTFMYIFGLATGLGLAYLHLHIVKTSRENNQ